MSLRLLILSVGCLAFSGVPSLLLGRRSGIGQWIAALINVVGSIIGGVGLIAHLLNDASSVQLSCSWALPFGKLAVGIDALSALFLIPMLLISALGSIYGLEYWKQSDHPDNGRKLRLCWGLLTAAMMLVVLARDGVVLLIAWEIMAWAAFFLVATEDEKPEVRSAAWIYLVAAHVGTLLLFALFGLLRYASGSFDLWPTAADGLPSWLPAAIFITGTIGFGLKAGIMPLHVWLPGAHANAPSHVSAILSGVLLKTGIYGIIRVASFLPHPPIWWGMSLLIAGSISGVLGIAFAVAQHDFKRLMAYSSIENIGIITIGIGLALLGRSCDRLDWIVLGLGGALLHVLNHSLFKPLLFMGAGSILHAVHTRQIDVLGGLAKTMPRTFRLMIVGAVAICGLPPLNGFVSELLIYVGLFRTAGVGTGPSLVWAALAAPVLAIIGALAVSAFAKLIGIVFGGAPRTAAEHAHDPGMGMKRGKGQGARGEGEAEHAHDPGMAMLLPMFILAGCCAIIGLIPSTVLGLVERAAGVWNPALIQSDVSIQSFIPIYWISAGGFVLVFVVLAGVIALRKWRISAPVASAGTWDCGFIRPDSRMQYTGTSFGQMLAGLFNWILLSRKSVVSLGGLFAGRSNFSSDTPDTVLDRGLLPAFALVERILSWVRLFQRGAVQVYLVYVLATLLALLLFAWW